MTKPVGPADDTLSGQAQTRLKSLVDRVERLIEDRDSVNADIKEVLAEAKGEGFTSRSSARSSASTPTAPSMLRSKPWWTSTYQPSGCCNEPPSRSPLASVQG